jgi:hypothetical protein
MNGGRQSRRPRPALGYSAIDDDSPWSHYILQSMAAQNTNQQQPFAIL